MRLALETSMKVDAKMVVGACLDAAAELAVVRTNIHEAARLVGAASRLQEELGWARNSSEQTWFEQTARSVRDALGADVAAAEIQRGRELSLHEAVAVALAATADGT
jgi:hypothetical protein